MQFRVIVVTDPQTHTRSHRQDRLQYTVPQLARSVTKIIETTTRTTNKTALVTAHTSDKPVDTAKLLLLNERW